MKPSSYICAIYVYLDNGVNNFKSFPTKNQKTTTSRMTRWEIKSVDSYISYILYCSLLGVG